MERPLYIFAGGGTGGHLMPGLAVAAEIAAAVPDAEILFLGSERPLEQPIVINRGFNHASLPVASLAAVRRNPLAFGWRMWRSYLAARKICRNGQPLAVIGLGGLTCVPTIVAGTHQRIPTVLLEQNVICGRAIKALNSRVDAVCVSFADTAGELPRARRIVTTGNPVRPEIAALYDRPTTGFYERRTLLVLGGSQGAAAVNDAVLEVVPRLRDLLEGWEIVHQTGPAQREIVRSEYERLGVLHQVEPFIVDMDSAYGRASLVVSRAGATTLAELACAGLPTVLIPYPFAAADHQTCNADFFKKKGAAIIAPQHVDKSGTADSIERALRLLLAEPERRSGMSAAMRRLARPEAARNVVQVLQSLGAVPIKAA